MRTTFILPVLLLALSASAQERKRPVTISLGGQVSAPRGEFDLVWGKEFVGLGGNFSVPFKRLPFEGGVQVNWSYMGGSTETVAVDVEHLEATEGTLAVNCNAYAFHGLMRFKPFTGVVAPYLDGLAGWRSFMTTDKLRVEDVDGPLSVERSHTDASFSYGWAAGVMVTLAPAFFVEGRVEKLHGDPVTYVDPNTIAIDHSGNVSFETRTSGADVMNFHLGIGFRF